MAERLYYYAAWIVASHMIFQTILKKLITKLGIRFLEDPVTEYNPVIFIDVIFI